MDEQRNLLIAIAVSIAILFGFSYFYERPRTAQQAQTTAEQTAAKKPEAAKTGAPGQPGSDTPQETLAPGAAPAPQAASAAGPRLPIETSALSGSINLTGAQIDDLTLNQYRETVDPQSPPIRLLDPLGHKDAYYVMQGWTSAQPGLALPGQDTVWSADAGKLTAGKPVTLSWDNGSGLKFTRTIDVDRDYMFTIRRTVRNDTGKPVTLRPYSLASRQGPLEGSHYYLLYEGPVGVLDGTLHENSYKDVSKEGKIETSSKGGWLGFSDKYWLVSIIPDQQTQVQAGFRHASQNGVDKYQVDYLSPEVTIQPGQSVEVVDRVFAGAKRVDLLNHYEDTLHIARFDMAVDWGWFWFLTKPIFKVLNWLHGVLGNLGLAILALTVMVKLLFFPLANKSYRAMSGMKKLQPIMMELRERYGDDKARLNQEMMELYRRERINPAAGCLPILVQIPVFFSLYKTLFVTIEMRHAPFFGWIHDLSAPDPTNVFTLFGLIPWDAPHFLHLGIWPLLMGVSMWLQMRLNPQPADPVQAKVFMIMPVVFTFMLAPFAAGLVIYWTWNNLLSMTQQWVIMRSAARHEARKGGPPAKKAKAKAEAR